VVKEFSHAHQAQQEKISSLQVQYERLTNERQTFVVEKEKKILELLAEVERLSKEKVKVVESEEVIRRAHQDLVVKHEGRLRYHVFDK
jgi:uncharacterized protein (DUF488 family)